MTGEVDQERVQTYSREAEAEAEAEAHEHMSSTDGGRQGTQGSFNLV